MAVKPVVEIKDCYQSDKKNEIQFYRSNSHGAYTTLTTRLVKGDGFYSFSFKPALVELQLMGEDDKTTTIPLTPNDVKHLIKILENHLDEIEKEENS